jgi:hypothetical protein
MTNALLVALASPSALKPSAIGIAPNKMAILVIIIRRKRAMHLTSS